MKPSLRLAILLCFLVVSSCGIREIPKAYEEVTIAIDTLNNYYTERNALVPKLMDFAEANLEMDPATIEMVTQSHEEALKAFISLDDLTEKSLSKFQKTHMKLGTAIAQVMFTGLREQSTRENEEFQKIIADIQKVEKQITLTTEGYREVVERFNALISKLPEALVNQAVFHHEPVPHFSSTFTVPS